METDSPWLPTKPCMAVVHRLFEDTVKGRGASQALVRDGRSLTYSELNAKANRLARHLIAHGVSRGSVVAICADRSIEMVIGLLAILKAGAAYVPLDPSYPPDRLKFMLEDADPRILLVERATASSLPETSLNPMCLDQDWIDRLKYTEEDLQEDYFAASPQDLVYVIYTSGSTGKPKGIAMSHGSMASLLAWHCAELPILENTRVLQYAALGFDVAFQEIFTTLCSGGTLVLIEEWIRRDGRELAKALRNQGVGRLFIPPVLLQNLAEYYTSEDDTALPSLLGDVICAGEQLRVSRDVVCLFERLPNCRLHNHYGPTETHVVSSLTLTGDPSGWPPVPSIGRPILNSRIYMLSEHQSPVPQGEIGEVCIGGAGIARGYFGKPALTAERFLPDRFTNEPSDRIYRTGDSGRLLPDGTVEYLGRQDDQVKVRGHRVELGEIEIQLGRHPLVKDVVALGIDSSTGSGKDIVAYITTRDGNAVCAADLRAFLGTTLPEYMLPLRIQRIEKFPLTPNGKIDRRALPQEFTSQPVHRLGDLPSEGIETKLAVIWQELLKIGQVHRNANFFELGGNSILMMRALERLRKLGLSVHARQMFEAPTLAELARTVEMSNDCEPDVPPNTIPNECDRITPEMLPLVDLSQEQIEIIASSIPGAANNIQDIYPLTPLQEGILFHHLLNDEHKGDTYVVASLLSIASHEILTNFLRALQLTIDRHDVLRTAFFWTGMPRPVQVVLRRAELVVEEHVVVESESDHKAVVNEWLSPSRQNLKLSSAPLVRVRVAEDRGSSCWWLLFQIHHLICDHESLEALFADLGASLSGNESTEQCAAYREHVARVLRISQTANAEAYFRKALSGIDEITAPFGISDIQGDATRLQMSSAPLDSRLAVRIRECAKSLGVSVAVLFHAAWGLVVANTSGRDDIVFGTLLLGRLHSDKDGQRIPGLFMNTLPLRMRFRGVGAQALVQQVRAALAELLDYEQTSLTVAQRCGSTNGTQLFTSLFNYRHSAAGIGRPGTLIATGIRLCELREWTNYPLTAAVDDFGDGFSISAKTDCRVDPNAILRYFVTALSSLVDTLEGTANTSALDLAVLSDDEMDTIIGRFNATGAVYPRDALVHELFEAQVLKTPDAVSLICGSDRLSYGELNRCANALANRLQIEGIAPGDRVGLFAERSLEAVIGILGVLKAGAAYVPLDPGYPNDRLLYLVSDADPKLILTQRKLVARLGQLSTVVVIIDADGDREQGSIEGPRGLHRRGLTSEYPAYLMYTSGSTGLPKGVMVLHRNVVNYSTFIAEKFRVAAGGGAYLGTSINFDLCLTGLFPPLFTGRQIRLREETGDILGELLEGRNQSPVKLTPTHLKMLAIESADISGCVDTLVLGGESLTEAAIRPWRIRSPKTRVFNHYGPTETTVGCVVHEVAGERDGMIPIGRPIANTQIYILSKWLTPVPIGVTGEIFVGGAGVASGYWRRPSLTAERFLPDPYSQEAAARMYRTGDYGRWTPEGVIEYSGRSDGQVKINGFRVELQEIEFHLLRSGVVRQAAVVARRDGPGEVCLVGYIVIGGQAEQDASIVQALRAELKKSLPDYMIPKAFVALQSLPATANGKLNQSALPPPELDDFTSAQYVPPRGDTEILISEIWKELLRVARVGRNDNFFDLGGQSILAMQLVVRTRSSLSIDIPMRTPFEFPTLFQFSAEVDDLREAHLNDALSRGASDVADLLQQVAHMPDTAVNKLIAELRSHRE